jgi:chaperonin cofactor prefoldin
VQERSEQLQLRVSQLERQIACFQSEGDKLLGQCLRQVGDAFV